MKHCGESRYSRFFLRSANPIKTNNELILMPAEPKCDIDTPYSSIGVQKLAVSVNNSACVWMCILLYVRLGAQCHKKGNEVTK